MAQAQGQLLQDQPIEDGVKLPSPDEIQSKVETPVEAALMEDMLIEDVLVEEVSIDGMCGVY